MATLPDAKQMAHSITLVVRIKRADEWQLRLKIGSWLIRLAAWVMWMDIDLKEMESIE
jgi:hypothetical protein